MEISIKKPCHENWENMTPNEQGAFCHKCVKSVVDFSEKTIEEIKSFFSVKTEGRVCGRFRQEQMVELSFDAYFERFKTFNFTKKMAIVLYFTFGLWLFSAGTVSAQSSKHLQGDVAIENTTTPVKTGEVKVVTTKGDTTKCVKDPKQTEKEPMLMGKVAAPQNDPPKQKDKPKKSAVRVITPIKPANELIKGEAIATDDPPVKKNTVKKK